MLTKSSAVLQILKYSRLLYQWTAKQAGFYHTFLHAAIIRHCLLQTINRGLTTAWDFQFISFRSSNSKHFLHFMMDVSSSTMAFLLTMHIHKKVRYFPLFTTSSRLVIAIMPLPSSDAQCFFVSSYLKKRLLNRWCNVVQEYWNLFYCPTMERSEKHSSSRQLLILNTRQYPIRNP